VALHAQQQILNAVKAALLGATDADSNVFVDRMDPLKQQQLPAIDIAEDKGGEDAAPYLVHGHEQRTLGVVIECLVTDCSTAPADARALGLQVEKIVAASTALVALAKLGVRITNSRQANRGEGDRTFCARKQTWEFKYLVNPATPDVVA
jgi:hypothetical protein